MKIEDGEENLLDEDSVETALEDTLEYLGYDLVSTIQDIEEVDDES